MHKQIRQIGFTIVELLIVVVVIGILAALVVTAWNGITQRAKDSALAADLSQAKKQIEAFYAVNGSYPTANNCTNTAATEICLKTSPGNTLTYTFVSNTASPAYTLTGALGAVSVAKYSAYFDGSGDYLSTPANAAFSVGAPSGNTNDFTVELWAFPTSTTVTTLVATTYTGSTYWGFFANKDDSNANIVGMLNFFMTDSYRLQTAAGIFKANQWNHVAATRSGTILRLFVNGNLEATSTTSINPNSTGALNIGRDPSLGRDYSGYISNVRIVKGSAIYTANFSPPTTPLTSVSGTSFLTANASSFVDGSSNNLAITTYGNTVVSTQSPF